MSLLVVAAAAPHHYVHCTGTVHRAALDMNKFSNFVVARHGCGREFNCVKAILKLLVCKLAVP